MKRIKQYAREALSFLSLLDKDGKLSITNIAVVICVTKIAYVADPSIVDTGALLITLMNYSHKRLESNKASSKTKQDEFIGIQDTLAKVVEVQNKITQDMIEIKAGSDKLQTVTDQAQKLVSNSNLAAAFTPRNRG